MSFCQYFVDCIASHHPFSLQSFLYPSIHLCIFSILLMFLSFSFFVEWLLFLFLMGFSSLYKAAPLLSHSFFSFFFPSDRVKMSLSLRRMVLMVGLVLMLTAFITGQTDGYRTQTHKCGCTHMQTQMQICCVHGGQLIRLMSVLCSLFVVEQVICLWNSQAVY